MYGPQHVRATRSRWFRRTKCASLGPSTCSTPPPMKSRKQVRSTATADRPQAAQTDAIRRLIEQGNLPEADKRLQWLRARFPRFTPLHGLAFELAAASGERALMLVEAWTWTQAAPNSVAAWSALADSTSAENAALYLAALQRLDELNGLPARPLPPMAAHPFGAMSPEEARQLELGTALLAVQRFDQAEKVFAPIDHPVARNNLALAHFAQGRIERARDEWEACWRAVPDNLFALERAITARMWVEGRSAAEPFEAALANTGARRPEDAGAQLAALAVLDRIDDAEAVYRAHSEREWWNTNLAAAAWFHYVGAYVAWRLNDRDGALNRLEAAQNAAPEIAPSEATGAALVQSMVTRNTPSWSIGDVSAWWPLASLLALRGSGARTDAELVVALGMRPPHPDYLALMATLGGETGRALALGVLKGLAEGGDTAAIDALKGLLCVPCGPDSVRNSIHAWLLDHGHVASSDTVELYVQGELRSVRPLKIEIHSEYTPDEELQPADAEAYDRAFNLASDGKMAEALAALDSLHRAYPRSARVMTALANIKRALNHPMSEIELLVRTAWETDSDYLFARTAMACLLAGQGDTDAAREVLAPLMERKRFHYSEWRSLVGAQLAIAHAVGDVAGVLAARAQLEDLEQRF